jgi:hypothetical protein
MHSLFYNRDIEIFSFSVLQFRPQNYLFQTKLKP